jgi:CRISPR/Cas system CSM-associated protein Csm2 small subunit
MTYNRQPSRPINPSGSPFPSQPLLPPGYLKGGYFDKNGNILEEVIIQWPQHLAKVFHESRPQLKTAQLRKFFQEVRHQEGRLASGIAFASLKTEILKLDSYAFNALKKNNAPILFRNFIEQNIKFAVMDEKSFKAFVTHFECIVGYYLDTK